MDRIWRGVGDVRAFEGALLAGSDWEFDRSDDDSSGAGEASRVQDGGDGGERRGGLPTVRSLVAWPASTNGTAAILPLGPWTTSLKEGDSGPQFGSLSGPLLGAAEPPATLPPTWPVSRWRVGFGASASAFGGGDRGSCGRLGGAASGRSDGGAEGADGRGEAPAGSPGLPDGGVGGEGPAGSPGLPDEHVSGEGPAGLQRVSGGHASGEPSSRGDAPIFAGTGATCPPMGSDGQSGALATGLSSPPTPGGRPILCPASDLSLPRTASGSASPPPSSQGEDASVSLRTAQGEESEVAMEGEEGEQEAKESRGGQEGAGGVGGAGSVWGGR